ncbi:hypothetical protein GCM10011514_09670 [Emticicia aquatilis]|uniref:HTH LytTR-type domain-containing protein n=1 Tax=Emticicia aquatilis TaxID=1537369 RepID=A0A916YKA7_9BACT|nr:LytTR family DNA-binding domain-containing protein [Emticicia aquatilis]GGD47752.1 hypothetical protein GCM10011514_09670 [Emticicia aquatilis]
MLRNYKDLENIDDFQFLQKKQNYWYLCKENEADWEKYAFVEDINFFLLQHTQFSKINESKIINLNFLIDSSKYNLEKLFFNNIVSKKYLPSIKLAYQILINKKNDAEVSEINPQISEKKKIKFNNIEVENIKFIVRTGKTTDIYFKDNSISYVYETLTTFEEKLLHSSKFIRISRGCIINIEHISFFRINTKKRFAELRIGIHPFKVSRRLISSFKSKANNITS